jgi:hypothetical protein
LRERIAALKINPCQMQGLLQNGISQDHRMNITAGMAQGIQLYPATHQLERQHYQAQVILPVAHTTIPIQQG